MSQEKKVTSHDFRILILERIAELRAELASTESDKMRAQTINMIDHNRKIYHTLFKERIERA